MLPQNISDYILGERVGGVEDVLGDAGGVRANWRRIVRPNLRLADQAGPDEGRAQDRFVDVIPQLSRACPSRSALPSPRFVHRRRSDGRVGPGGRLLPVEGARRG